MHFASIPFANMPSALADAIVIGPGAVEEITVALGTLQLDATVVLQSCAHV